MHAHSTYAMLFLDRDCERDLTQWFVESIGLQRRFVVKGMHLTVYHGRRRFDGLENYQEETEVKVPLVDLRFMAPAPGGENPRPDIDTTRIGIGARIHKSSSALLAIRAIRQRFYPLETADLLGPSRRASDAHNSAWGARKFQPHIKLLHGGSGIDPDLTRTGWLLRARGGALRFDRLAVRCRHPA